VGRRKAAVANWKSLRCNPALRQPNVNSAAMWSAKTPSPCMRTPNRASFSCPPRSARMRCRIFVCMDRKNKRPFRPAPLATRGRQLLLARGDGSVLSPLSAARSSGAQYGVAWLCSSLDLRLRSAAGCGAGVARCEGLGTTGWGKPGGGRLHTGWQGAQRCQTPPRRARRRRAHV